MQTLLSKINTSVIGANAPIHTPFGEKPLIYADYTASGRSLRFIEDYLQSNVLPWYANTHTETSFTGAQTTRLREEARAEIRKAVNGTGSDKVVFCGSGASSAIDKIMHILGLKTGNTAQNSARTDDGMQSSSKAVVFVGPYEHHSNELPWRESNAQVVCIPLTKCGQIDINVLKQKLEQYDNRTLKIGSFSAASNVTGICSDVQGITQMLKQHGALSFWDYAAAAPYVKIDMNGAAPIDAVFISPHKFVGGPGTPGVLVVKEHIVRNTVPALVGGGTVAYVTPTRHVFIGNIERKEEGGTPAIIESIRAGLVFKLQQQVGIETIEKLEQSMVDRAMAVFNSVDNIEVLGSNTAKRLSIFSLRFKHRNKDLHYAFITALLNDLFGIQARGGCSCAGPYGHALLNMDYEYSEKIEQEISRGNMALRPGWVRLNFNYFISEAEFTYVLSALKLVAEHGWRLLPYYKLDRSAWSWRYQGKLPDLPASLEAFNPIQDCANHQALTAEAPCYEALLKAAENELTKSRQHQAHCPLELSPSSEALRWFALPQDCYNELQTLPEAS
ncbi:aminotransferase class V-fold PLP-dependent enzyme [Glaciecola sp. SC05]|uniref:aminotransferase class V-fold PLP-dependent enzyme n=1 Tax=Glaciecola sp. SC05 TaxID=1987355 RepID=UPI003527A559